MTESVRLRRLGSLAVQRSTSPTTSTRTAGPSHSMVVLTPRSFVNRAASVAADLVTSSTAPSSTALTRRCRRSGSPRCHRRVGQLRGAGRDHAGALLDRGRAHDIGEHLGVIREDLAREHPCSAAASSRFGDPHPDSNAVARRLRPRRRAAVPDTTGHDEAAAAAKARASSSVAPSTMSWRYCATWRGRFIPSTATTRPSRT